MKDRVVYEPFDEWQTTASAENEKPTIVDIPSLLAVLSPREEEMLLLRLEEMKYREIADQLGISMNSVNTLLARALRKLQQAIAPIE